MDNPRRIASGIDGLDRAIDGLRSGDTVLWQVEHIRDYMYAATRFVTSTARGGQSGSSICASASMTRSSTPRRWPNAART